MRRRRKRGGKREREREREERWSFFRSKANETLKKTSSFSLLSFHSGRSAKTNFPIADYDAEIAAATAAGVVNVPPSVAATAAATAAASHRARGVPPAAGGLLLRAPVPAATITVSQVAAALLRPR